MTLEINASTDMTWVAVTDPIPGGSTILGSGDVALILDVPSLVQQAMANAEASVAATGRRSKELASVA